MNGTKDVKVKREPRKIFDTRYTGPKQQKVDSVIDFEPRSASVLEQNEPVERVDHSLIFNFQSQNISNCMWGTLLEYKYDGYALSD